MEVDRNDLPPGLREEMDKMLGSSTFNLLLVCLTNEAEGISAEVGEEFCRHGASQELTRRSLEAKNLFLTVETLVAYAKGNRILGRVGIRTRPS